MRHVLSCAILMLLLTSCQKKEAEPLHELFELIEGQRTKKIGKPEYRTVINEYAKDGTTPLYYALKEHPNETALIAQLISLGADPYTQIESLNTYPIRRALYYSNLDTLRVVSCSGADLNTKFLSYEKDNKIYDRYPTILFDATLSGSPERIELLLNCGADIEVENEFGQTPVFVAASTNFKAFDLLASKGADLSVEDKFGVSICDRISSMPDGDGTAKLEFLSSMRKFGLMCP